MDLLYAQVGAKLRNEIARYYLNYAWWVIDPILTMITFYIVFGIMLNRGTPNFTGFLLVGITSWMWFARSVNSGSMSILAGRGLMMQVKLHKSFFPLSVVIQDAFKQIFVVSLLLVFLIFYPTPVTWYWLFLPILMLVQLILIGATTLFCASIVPFLPDLTFIIQTIIQLMFFASGIFFSIENVVGEQHQAIAYLNPMAGLIKNYRNILIYGQPIDWTYIVIVALFSVVFFIISLCIISYFNYIYPRVCQ